MKVSIEIELKPFEVPEYVYQEIPPALKQEGFKELPKHRLSQLDPNTLDRLCDQFRDAVFEKAGKRPPPQVLPG